MIKLSNFIEKLKLVFIPKRARKHSQRQVHEEEESEDEDKEERYCDCHNSYSQSGHCSCTDPLFDNNIGRRRDYCGFEEPSEHFKFLRLPWNKFTRVSSVNSKSSRVKLNRSSSTPYNTSVGVDNINKGTIFNKKRMSSLSGLPFRISESSYGSNRPILVGNRLRSNTTNATQTYTKFNKKEDFNFRKNYVTLEPVILEPIPSVWAFDSFPRPRSPALLNPKIKYFDQPQEIATDNNPFNTSLVSNNIDNNHFTSPQEYRNPFNFSHSPDSTFIETSPCPSTLYSSYNKKSVSTLQFKSSFVRSSLNSTYSHNGSGVIPEASLNYRKKKVPFLHSYRPSISSTLPSSSSFSSPSVYNLLSTETLVSSNSSTNRQLPPSSLRSQPLTKEDLDLMSLFKDKSLNDIARLTAHIPPPTQNLPPILVADPFPSQPQTLVVHPPLPKPRFLTCDIKIWDKEDSQT